MNRHEFIDKLRTELSKLPTEERDAAVEFYEEYFDEAGPEQEAAIIAELGSPKKLAGQIRAEYGVRMLDEEPGSTAKKGLSAVWWVIIGICSAPVSISLAVCLVILVICGVVLVISGVLVVFALLLTAAVAAIVAVALGVMAMPVAVSTGLLFLGSGIAGLGVTAALSVAVVLGIRAAVKALVRVIRGRNEKRRLEKLARRQDAGLWTYREDGLDVAKGAE